MSDFLFEIGCEELPSKAVLRLSVALLENIKAELMAHEIPFDNMQGFGAPRRLAVLISDLPLKEPSRTIERKGPSEEAAFEKEGVPSKALEGFARSCNVSIDKLSLKQTDKGKFFVFESVTEGRSMSVLLPLICEKAVRNLPLEKPMRWGSGETLFARPVHWILMLLDKEVVPANILGIDSGNITYGHRFHSEGPIYLEKASDYEKVLKDISVIPNFEARKEEIERQIKVLEASKKAKAHVVPELLEEVTSIVEWPNALIVSFDKKFLTLPKEVLLESMQKHQKCFALKNEEDNTLLPYFITVSNLQSRNPESVVRGNERVMHARLSDAMFFYDEDCKKSFQDYREQTKSVIFQAKLGSMYDKTERLKKLLTYLAPLFEVDMDEAMRTAELSRCDLMTGMVKEFPELEGTMGYYYALKNGEKDAVSKALFEQYLPRFSKDDLPASQLGLAAALADRLDTLVGLYGVGGEPKNDKDPFKLRRHALALARLLITSGVSLKLSTLISKTLEGYQGLLEKDAYDIDRLMQFIFDRLPAHYDGEGFPKEWLEAVSAVEKDNLLDVDKRLRALFVFCEQEEAPGLLQAMKRVQNLLSNSQSFHANIDVNTFVEPEEKALFSKLCEVEKAIAPMIATQDYIPLFVELSSLGSPLDHFFEKVMVNVDDKKLRDNRCSLLSRLKDTLSLVADIARIKVL